MVRETDQTVYSIQLDRIESFQTREGVRLNATGNVESLMVFPGSDLRKICKAQ